MFYNMFLKCTFILLHNASIYLYTVDYIWMFCKCKVAAYRKFIIKYTKFSDSSS